MSINSKTERLWYIQTVTIVFSNRKKKLPWHATTCVYVTNIMLRVGMKFKT